MTNTSGRPITVDGVRLDTLAWNVQGIHRAMASRRANDLTIPGVDGVVPSLNDDLDPVAYGLDMFVMGTDANGSVPAAGRADTFMANLDELLHLFGTRHRLLDVQEQVNATDTRRAYAKVVDSIAPDVNDPGSAGSFTVGLSLVDGCWQDLAVVTSASMTGWVASPTQEVVGLQGATERSTDTVVLVTGPVTNPRLTDATTGAYVQLTLALAAGDTWRVNVGTWATRSAVSASALTLASSDASGTDRQSVTTFGGTKNQARFLPLTPVRDTGLRRVKVTLSGSSGITAATAVRFQTLRRFAV